MMAKMKPDDLESEMRNLRLIHASESELALYCDHQLDQLTHARVEAHVKQCFICERDLELLQEESEALRRQAVTVEDEAFVGRLMRAIEPQQKTDPAKTSRVQSLRERMADYLSDLSASWRIQFASVRRDDHGEEVWRWRSDDGKLQAKARIQKNADLMFQISSEDMDLEGARLHFSLGLLSQELTLQKISESLVVAQVAVPARYRQGSMSEILIEFI
jgi:hypothetical protein